MPRLSLVASIAVLCVALPGSAFALSTKDCSVKYQAAKQDGTLNGQKWNDFRKAECGAAPDKATETVPNPMAPNATTAAAPPPASAPRPTTTAAKPAPAPVATGSAVYPRAIDPKYASLSPGKGRMQTCLDQYKANKASGASGNGGMTWIQKGGGYYSMCNKQLKG